MQLGEASKVLYATSKFFPVYLWALFVLLSVMRRCERVWLTMSNEPSRGSTCLMMAPYTGYATVTSGKLYSIIPEQHGLYINRCDERNLQIWLARCLSNGFWAKFLNWCGDSKNSMPQIAMKCQTSFAHVRERIEIYPSRALASDTFSACYLLIWNRR